jgi:DNA-binding transcriptional MerR regulator
MVSSKAKNKINNKVIPTRALPPIPDKRYFAIGEASALCATKPHVLRYWEQEFPALNPPKRRGNRRYYRREDLIMARRIRSLLYEQGFTIAGARAQLRAGGADVAGSVDAADEPVALEAANPVVTDAAPESIDSHPLDAKALKNKLRDIRLELEALIETF